MNTNTTYPYISVQDHNEAWEFYMTVKPGRRVYLQGITKEKLAAVKRKTASNKYLNRLERIGTNWETRSKAEAARLFYGVEVGGVFNHTDLGGAAPAIAADAAQLIFGEGAAAAAAAYMLNGL